jgi:adenylate kinase
MLRQAIADKTELGRKANEFIASGALVPDEVVIGLIRERISRADCSNGFILDGFPRTIPQAEALDGLLSGQGKKIASAVLFEIPEGELVRRLTGRRTCSQCGAMFHIENMPPKMAGKCDQCSSALVQRDDDKEEVIRKRLQVYSNQTLPLVGFYKSQNKLLSLDARQSPEQVMTDLVSLVQKMSRN